MSSIASAPDEIEPARAALLQWPAIEAVSVTSPCEDPYDAWTFEATLLRRPLTDADGLEPRHQRTAAEHGLTVREIRCRSDVESRAVLTLSA